MGVVTGFPKPREDVSASVATPYSKAQGKGPRKTRRKVDMRRRRRGGSDALATLLPYPGEIPRGGGTNLRMNGLKKPRHYGMARICIAARGDGTADALAAECFTSSRLSPETLNGQQRTSGMETVASPTRNGAWQVDHRRTQRPQHCLITYQARPLQVHLRGRRRDLRKSEKAIQFGRGLRRLESYRVQTCSTLLPYSLRPHHLVVGPRRGDRSKKGLGRIASQDD